MSAPVQQADDAADQALPADFQTLQAAEQVPSDSCPSPPFHTPTVPNPTESPKSAESRESQQQQLT